MGEEKNLDSSPPSTTGEENLRRIIDEIESLSSLSHTIRVFSVKWQVIQKKLDELTNFLVAAKVSHAHHPKYTTVQVPIVGCNSNNIHSPLSDAFMGISNIVMECRELAARCINVSYSGKLLMQSDLDTFISKLDDATRSLAAIFRSSGVVTGDLAFVVLKPPLGATQFLQSMASRDENVRQLVIKEGGIRGLVWIIDPKSNLSFKSREIGLRAIENLCFSPIEHVNMLISYGFMDQLLFLLKGDVSIQELAYKSSCRLCGTSEDARKAMGDVGFMAEFLKFLEAKSYEIREMASKTLSTMVLLPKNRKKFANDDHKIGLILQLLDPKERNSGNFKFLLSILLSLSNCNHARKKISHCGYVKNI